MAKSKDRISDCDKGKNPVAYRRIGAASHELHRCGLLPHVSHVAWSVCMCVGHMGETLKAALSRKGMNGLFWGLTRVGLRNHVLINGDRDPSRGGGNFGGCPAR